MVRLDPIRDKEIIDIELQFKDLETVEKKMSSIKRAAQTGDKEAQKQLVILEGLKSGLESGKSARAIVSDENDPELIKDLQLLTLKPVLYVCNVDEGSVVEGNEYVEKVKAAISEENAGILIIGAAIEADINELDSYEDRQLFLEEIGLAEPGVNKLIREAYSLLKLQTYFTAGVKEVRAWTIHSGYSPTGSRSDPYRFRKGFYSGRSDQV